MADDTGWVAIEFLDRHIKEKFYCKCGVLHDEAREDGGLEKLGNVMNFLASRKHYVEQRAISILRGTYTVE